ncbi:thiamine diphosphokinase [Enterocloster lavalensis]|mgnify:FL=1|jgi:thiamine pyrophosphokinase|uniref:thiamine diphosphokinase n=1 Tax=Enterocloster lavalensis TaxID=460384 RepID=UPI001D08BA50|nr:thiamine diphosphokinase [Enterocloster lavalensis]MCB6343985.1 thiamine diphosphokinase [Enterocloster lavalensis]
MRRCLIITGGTIDLDFAGSFLENERFDKVIAVDAGLERAAALGLVPDLIVGDFDTVKPEILEQYRRMEHIVWDVHQPEKDETDTELALQKAQAIGSGEIAVLGATGGRIDHMLGNIHLLFPCLQKGIHAWLADPQNRIYLIDGEHEFKRSALWGKYISFLPLTEQVNGITLEGFKYPLFEKDIEIGTSLCISNELTGETGRITFTDGVLICVESHD